MLVELKQGGKTQVGEEALLDFPHGLYGFETHTRFALIKDERNPGNPFMWLQSLSDRQVCFAVLDAARLFRDYCPEVPAPAKAELSVPEGKVPLFLVIADLPKAGGPLFLNLKCPVVVDPEARRGIQLILEDERYPMRYSLPPKGEG